MLSDTKEIDILAGYSGRKQKAVTALRDLSFLNLSINVLKKGMALKPSGRTVLSAPVICKRYYPVNRWRIFSIAGV